MSVVTENWGSAAVNKSFVSKHKKELLLVAGLITSVALGLFLSPDIGVGVGALTCFLYGAAELLAPPSVSPRKISQKQRDIERPVATNAAASGQPSADPKPVDPRFVPVKEATQADKDANRAARRAARVTRFGVTDELERTEAGGKN